MPPLDYPRLPTHYRFDPASPSLRSISILFPDSLRDGGLRQALRVAAGLALAAHAGEERYEFRVEGGEVVEGEVNREETVGWTLERVEETMEKKRGEDGVRLTVELKDDEVAAGVRDAPATPLHLVVDVSSSKNPSATLSFDSSLIPELQARWFLSHVVTGTRAILQASRSTRISTISLAPSDELAIFGQYCTCPSTIHEPDAYPSSVKTLPDFFLHAAEQYPDDPALHFIPDVTSPQADSLVLSFSQLAYLARFLASHILLSLDASQLDGQHVLPVVLDKSPAMIISLLAASLAGFGYLALEPSFPEGRKRGICEELAEKGMLASAAVVQSADGEKQKWESWQNDEGEEAFSSVIDPQTVLAPLLNFLATSSSTSITDLASHFPLPDLSSVGGLPTLKEDGLAYVIYTSGTTGKPKGIMVEHRNVAAFLRNYRGVFGRARGERVLQFPSYSFDVSVMNIWDTLAHGSTVCITTPASLFSSLADTILALDCTLADLTPTIAALLFEHEEAQPRAGESVEQAWRRAGFRIKQVNTGGEKVDKSVREKWRERGVRVCIDYGPTETTVGVISNQSLAPSPPPPFSLPIGKPTGNTRIYILPSHSPDALTPLPLGCIGEICVLGPQVTRGYVRQELNKGVFVELNGDERIGEKGERLYRTGDLGRWVVAGWEEEGEKEGWIECLGRKDGQVKVNGLRIEVGEIEENLSSKADPAIVRGIVDKVDAPGIGTALVAFLELSPSFVSDGTASPASTRGQHHSHSAGSVSILPLSTSPRFSTLCESLKTRLGDKLPTYMVPRYWLAVNRIPTQGMGKADRKTLRGLAEEWDWQAAARSRRAKGTNGSGEEEVAERHYTRSPHFDAARRAWAKVLRLQDDPAGDNIADEDAFMKLGGDSIRFMKLVSVIRSEGYPGVAFRDLVEAATLADCAAVLERKGGAGTQTNGHRIEQEYRPFSLIPEDQKESLFAELDSASLPRSRISDVYPTAPAQDALLAPSFDSPCGHYYAQAVYAVGVSEAKLPLERLQHGIEKLVRRHDVLRGVFFVSDTLGRTVSILLKPEDEEVKHRCRIEEIQVGEAKELDAVVSSWLRQDRHAHSFDWGRLSLSFALFSLPDRTRKLAWSMHHAMSDGWTLELLTLDLRNLCFDIPIPDRLSFGAVASWWLSETTPLQDTIAFWRSYLDGAKPLGWPSQDPLRGEMLATTGAAIQHWSGELDALSQRSGITPAIASRLAILVALQHHTGSSDVNVGIVRSGRDIDVADADEIIGPCVSVLPSRIRFDPNSSLLSLAKAEAEADRRARVHQHVTLSQLARFCDLPGRADLFDILVTFQSLAERDPAVENAALWPVRQPPERIHMPTNYTLSFEITPEMHNKDKLELACFFDERIIEKSEVDEVLKTVGNVLDYLTTAPCTKLRDVKLGEGATPARHLSKQANGTARPSPVNGSKKLDPALSATVQRLATEWASVLRVLEADIGPHDSFASFGGDSIATMRLAVRLSKAGLAIPTQALAKLPTLADQADWLRRKET
ncbi:Nonribosomal peptide synthetase 4 [Rhodotorula toruloides ATCC 204091]|uniref:Nonribosomal peptide synthetase 4 n=1 Tax=Rhodotorula toruloides TaxID=5286 RepID=A0A0K3CCY9_RHOTO|nr:Nonribosomal peptide synthetase 4 [Rhodotorula toruloides ATCC 204091]KAK4330945.1 Nonribosomal peptide synthetase 4 [Rhodotorula toruloides]PRQ75546.1 Nonribosomal peptide synthetase 4 [Rhodotorula toruloides]